MNSDTQCQTTAPEGDVGGQIAGPSDVYASKRFWTVRVQVVES